MSTASREKLTEEQREALRDLHGFSRDGWTETDVEALNEHLLEALGYGCAVVWDYYDLWGAGGNSDIWLTRDDAKGRERRYGLPDGLWDLLQGEEDVEICLRRIEADLPPHRSKAGDFRWSRLHGGGPNRYIAFDPRRELD